MFTNTATDFIKQANRFEEHDDDTVFKAHPITSAAGMAGVGAVSGGAYGAGKYLDSLKSLAADDERIAGLEKQRKNLAENVIPTDSATERIASQKKLKDIIHEIDLHNAKKNFLKSKEGILMHVKKPAQVGAGVLGTGALAYGLYHRLKNRN